YDYRDVRHVGQCTGVASWARCRVCHLARASCAQSMACHGIIWPMLTLRPATPRCICGASSRPSDQAMISTPRWMWGSILHQGSLYSASPPVIWVLVDLLAAFPEHPAAEAILGGLATLAEGCLLMREEPDASTDVPVRCNAPGDPAWEVWVNAPLPPQDGVPKEIFSACRV